MNRYSFWCLLFIKLYSVSDCVFCQSDRSVDLLNMQITSELLLDVVLNSSKQQSLVKLFEMLDCYMLKQSIGDVVSLKLVLRSCKHPFDRIECWSILRNCKCQKLSFDEELLYAILLMYARIVKQENQSLSDCLPFIIIKLLKFFL